MNYIKQIKTPIDETAGILRTLPRIDHLVIVIKSESHEITFIEYVASGLLQLRGIKRAQCFYHWSAGTTRRPRESYSVKLRDHMMTPRMHSLERDLESLLAPKTDPQMTGLSAEAVEMFVMLEAMRDRMLLIRDLRSKYKDSEVEAALPVLTNIIRE